MLKEQLPIFLINTLLLHIPLLALTHGRTELQTKKRIVQQHHCQKNWPFSQEEGTCVIFFLYQLFWLTFGLCPQMKEIVDIFVVQRHVRPKLVLFQIEIKSLNIVSLQKILSSNFVWRNIQHAFNLSRCLCAEDFCNLHAILPYFSYSCINILCSSCVHLPLFILLIGKLAGTTFPDPKEPGIENKSQWQAIGMPSSQWNVWQTKNE